MSSNKSEEANDTCFVVMGFGKKTDFETGRTLDLDMTYNNIIKPAVEAAGLKCIRADEIEHSGIIDVPMYELLLNAKVVVADLSTSNKNAFYELGVRHALKPYTTIILCEDGIKSPLPFDLSHVVVRMYRHLGEDIGATEARKKSGELTTAIKAILGNDSPDPDSPVYTFIKGLVGPTVAAKIAEGKAGASLGEVVADALGGGNAETPAAKHEDIRSVLMGQVDEAQAESDFSTAQALLARLRKKMKEAAEKEAKEAADRGVKDIPERPEDPYIIQRLALVTYKGAEKKAKEFKKERQDKGQLTPEDEREIKEIQQKGYEEARELLKTLEPQTSNDTETVGLWGAVHKRLWDVTGDARYLDEAVNGYERGFYLRNDYYNGINLAFLLNCRASAACRRADSAASAEEILLARADAVSCFVQAGKVRREVLSICDKLLNTEQNLSNDQKYWVLATMAEARLGIGEGDSAEQKLQEAFAIASAPWMKDSTQEQLDKLRLLLADAPLKYLKTNGN